MEEQPLWEGHGLTQKEAFSPSEPKVLAGEYSKRVLLCLRDFWEMHRRWCMAWRSLREAPFGAVLHVVEKGSA